MTGSARSVRAVRDRSGGGEVLQVLVGDAAVWTWAAHVDGPPSGDAEALFSALERSLPAGDDQPVAQQAAGRLAAGARHFRCGHDHDDGEPCPGTAEAQERWCAMCSRSSLTDLGTPCAAAPSGLHYWSVRERPQAADEAGGAPGRDAHSAPIR